MATRLKPGLVSISFRKYPAEVIIEECVKTKLCGIEWGGDVHVPHGDISKATQVSRWTRDAGLAVCAYGSYYKFADCLSGGKSDGPEFESILDTAEALGASMIRIWAGEIASEKASEDWRQTVAEKTRQYADLADGRNMRIGFEFHEYSLTDTYESTLALLEDINRFNVTSFWQTYLQVSHEYRLSGLKKLVDQVSNIHCNYFGQNPWPNMLSLKEGEDEWMDFLTVFLNSGRDYWLTLEHIKDQSLDHFHKEAETLHRWLSKLNGV